MLSLRDLYNTANRSIFRFLATSHYAIAVTVSWHSTMNTKEHHTYWAARPQRNPWEEASVAPAPVASPPHSACKWAACSQRVQGFTPLDLTGSKRATLRSRFTHAPPEEGEGRGAEGRGKDERRREVVWDAVPFMNGVQGAMPFDNNAEDCVRCTWSMANYKPL